MPLGMEVGLGPGDDILDGAASRSPLVTEVDLGPGHIMLDGDQLTKGAQQPPFHFFGPCLLSPQSPISATAELLLPLTRAVQPVAICRQSPYLYKPATVIVMPFSYDVAAPVLIIMPISL